MHNLINEEVKREDLKMVLFAMLTVDPKKRPKFRELQLGIEEATKTVAPAGPPDDIGDF